MLDRRAPSEPAPEPTRPGRVLLAEDDALSRKLLATALTRSNFEVITASDGEETLRLIAEGAPDLLVLDFEMPGLNGAEVCQRLRASDRADWQTLPIIMLTAHSGEEEEIRCLQAGANDFVTKPVSREVLAARIHTQLRLQILADEMRAQNEELARWRTTHEADLAAAQATQQALIPTTPPTLAGWSVQTIYQPVIQVGGDVFGSRGGENGTRKFWLADATGHGAAAALLTALTAQLFYQACESEQEPEAILRAVNREFRGVFRGRSFMTGCCAVVDPGGLVSFFSAGHPPLLVRRANGAVESFGPHGIMLGLEDDNPADQSQVTLASGDLALLYTDGLFALKDGEDERFTHPAVATALASTPPGNDFFDRLTLALNEASNGEPRDDDLAALVLIKN